MKKTLFKMVATVLAVTTTLAMGTGCGGSSAPAEGEAAATSEGETAQVGGQLNLFVWTEYVPESVISSFEKESGVKVNVSYYSSNEDLYSKLKSESPGTYDVVLPSDYMVEKMIAQDMLEPIDKTKIENIANVGESYLNREFDPENKFTAPYMGGVCAIAVNTDKVTKDIKSYGDLFDPEFAGQEVVLDDSRAVIGMTAKSLGYSMSTTDQKEIDEIKTKLLTIKNNVKVYDSDSPKSVLISGDCSLGMVWGAEIALAMEENPAIKIVYPSEGAYVFLDNWAITKGAKNVEQANAFINYMLSAEASAACSEELPYLNPNTKACEILGDDYLKNEAKNVPADVIAKGEWLHNLDVDTQAKYEAMWTELKK